MATSSIEERLSTLESQMAQLLQSGAGSQAGKDWRRTLGMFTGDDVMKQIDQHALRFREEDRARSLKQFDVGSERT